MSARVGLVACSMLALGAGCEDVYPFDRVDSAAPLDPVTDRLCEEAAAPDDAADPIFIHCALDTGSFADPNRAPPDSLVVYSYNVERGLRLDDQLRAIEEGTMGPAPDVLLFQEVDRGCSRSQFRDEVRAYAEALRMDYVFAVEFVELPRPSGAGGEITAPCEHGNAVLSRFPLGNAGAFRHRENVSWYLPPEQRSSPGEPRLGGNIAVYADVKLGDAFVHVYSIHFEVDLETGFKVQAAQARETASHVRARPFSAIVGGDFNSALYSFDLANDAHTDETVRPFFDGGFEDAQRGIPASERGTRNGAIVDLILVRDLEVVDRGICSKESCSTLSDHLPVWGELRR